MKGLFASFGAGLLFALGLGISGMTQPAKVVGFLDFFGAWDASLAFVMLGAVSVYALLHRRVMKRKGPLFDTRFHVPTRADLDKDLLLGAAIFGVGWGLAGYCPGPGLVTAASGSLPAIFFVGSMVIGMKLEHLYSHARAASNLTTRKVQTADARASR